jgi:hypothetical protein
MDQQAVDASLAAKRAEVQRAEQQRLAALSLPRPNKVPVPTKKFTTPPENWPSGIFVNGQAPFPGSVYSFENQWQGMLNGVHVNVYAGSLRHDRQQGLLIMTTTSMDLQARSSDIYFTPYKAGPLTILAQDGPALRLAGQSGARFVFNLSSRTWAVEPTS